MFKIEFKLNYDLKNINLNLIVKEEAYKPIHLRESMIDFDLEHFFEFPKEVTLVEGDKPVPQEVNI